MGIILCLFLCGLFLNPLYAQELTKSQRNKLLAAEKCKEYMKPLNKEYGILSLVAGAQPSTITIPDCEDNGEPLIVGGEPARDGEFPHMAIILYQNIDGKDVFKCGGSLISERYVLTAGHCLYNHEFGLAKKVRLGATHLNAGTYQEYNIEKGIKYPNYTRRGKYHDLALLRLDRDVKITKLVRPACLYTKEVSESGNVVAAGWGLTKQDGSPSNTLLKVGLEIYKNNVCEPQYKKLLKNGVSNDQICAGYQAGGKDTCQGDSGGPLMITHELYGCIFYVMGVTSQGIYCGAANIPSIYTKVPSYLDWIVENVW